MPKNKGMCFFYDWYQPLKMVPSEDFKELVLAMLEFKMTGKEPPSFENSLAQIAATFIFPQIERSRMFSEMGTKGGNASAKAKKNGGATNAATECVSHGATECVSHATTECATDASTGALTQDKTETKQDKTETRQDKRQDKTKRDGDKPSGGTPSGEADGGTDAECEKRFERFWSCYPRHVGKNAAREEFLKLSPSEELTEKIIAAVSAQRASEQWRREGGRFIPNPTTYLSQARWEDELCANADISDTAGKEFEEWFEAKLLQNFGP